MDSDVTNTKNVESRGTSTGNTHVDLGVREISVQAISSMNALRLVGAGRAG